MRFCLALSWILLVCMIGFLSILGSRQASEMRRRASGESEAVRAAIESLERSVSLQGRRQTGLLRRIVGAQDALADQVRRLGRWPSADVAPAAPEFAQGDVAEEATDDAELDYPPLPEAIDAEQFLRTVGMDLRSVVENPVYNPGAREPSRAEKLRMAADLKRGSATLEILDHELRASVAEGVEALRARGSYVDYKPGERYHQEPGVVSAGEPTEDGGVRLFHLPPEEFPAVYDLKEERTAVADLTVRRLLFRLQSGPLVGGSASEGGSSSGNKGE